MSTELDVSPRAQMPAGVTLTDTFPDSHEPELDAIPKASSSTPMQQDATATLLQLLAENCFLKLTLCKNRREQQAIIAAYAIKFSKHNDDPKTRARAFLEAEMQKHGVSQRTLLRMLPVELKNYSKMMNRLGKVMMTKNKESSQGTSENEGSACYVEPD
jgi:hypothetical protein